jgi:hypothetical protein
VTDDQDASDRISAAADMIRHQRETWSAETPHFGGIGPHRYDYGKHCIYCGRPVDWNPPKP